MRDYLTRLGLSPDMHQQGHPPTLTTPESSTALGVLGSLAIPAALSRDFGMAMTFRCFMDPLPPGDPRDPLDLIFGRMHRARSSPYQADYLVLGHLIGYVDPAVPLAVPPPWPDAPVTPTARVAQESNMADTPPAPTAPGWSAADFMHAQIGVLFNRTPAEQELFTAQMFGSPIHSPRTPPAAP